MFFAPISESIRRSSGPENQLQSDMNGVPPGIMKMQLRILRLRLRMTVPMETMRLIYRAVVFTGRWQWVNFQGRCFDCVGLAQASPTSPWQRLTSSYTGWQV